MKSSRAPESQKNKTYYNQNGREVKHPISTKSKLTMKIYRFSQTIRKIMLFSFCILSLKALLNCSVLPSERNIKHKISRVQEKAVERTERHFY